MFSDCAILFWWINIFCFHSTTSGERMGYNFPEKCNKNAVWLIYEKCRTSSSRIAGRYLWSDSLIYKKLINKMKQFNAILVLIESTFKNGVPRTTGCLNIMAETIGRVNHLQIFWIWHLWFKICKKTLDINM